MKERTKKEIKVKIKSVTKEYAKLPQFNFFGDNNWEQRDAIVDILNRALKDKFFDAEEKLEEFLVEIDENPNDRALEQRINTLDWLLGNSDEL